MFISFKSLVIVNFKAFKGKHTLALDYPGVTYVVGENRSNKRLYANGAAKSTLWDALCWCLYGKTPLGLRNTDVKPWSGGNTSVTIGLDIGDVQHVVQRSVNPNRFTVDGKDVGPIEELIGMSFELFINTVVLPQGQELFFDRTPSEKMELFSEALGLDRWDRRSEAASEATKQRIEEVAGLERELGETTAALQEVDRSLADLRRKSKEWADASQKKLRVGKVRIQELRKERDRKQTLLDTAKTAEDGALLEQRVSQREHYKEVRIIETQKAEFKRITSVLGELATYASTLRDDLTDLQKAKRCPTCGHEVRPSDLNKHKAHLRDKLNAIEAKHTHLKEAEAICKRELATAEARAKRHYDACDQFTRKANAQHDIYVTLSPEVAIIKSELERAVTDAEQENPHFQPIRDTSDRQRALKLDLEDIKRDLAKATAKLERTKFWVQGFKDIKLQLIEDVLQELELVANGMIEEVGLEDWKIKLDIERESKTGNIQRKIDVSIVSPESKGVAVKWESYSGGEKQRLRIAGSLALADVLLAHAGVETDLEVLDEPASYWSREGVQELSEFLATRAKDMNKSIYYTEHNVPESVHFSDTLRIIKDKKGAYIA